MRTIRTKVYNFNELVVDAQQNAIETERNKDYNVDLTIFKEDCVERIEEVGFCGDIKLQYDLSYSQGDGLSFSCAGFDYEKLVLMFVEILGENETKTAKLIADNCDFENTGNKGRGCFASKSDIDYILDDNLDMPNIENVVSKVLEKLEDLYMDLCKDLEKQGYSEIEHQNSDEYISENLISNEYEFTKDGNRFYN
jgi:hypothetical protein